ncbi:hypothetical protein D3C84_1143990 [compost metagenome]
MVPEGVVLCCGFLLQHVEHRGAELAAGQSVEQVRFHQVAAATHIDQRCAFGQVLEQLTVENPLGLLGQRQDAQQDVALGEKSRQLFGAGKTVDPG